MPSLVCCQGDRALATVSSSPYGIRAVPHSCLLSCEREAIVFLQSPVKKGIRGPSLPAVVSFFLFPSEPRGEANLLGN